MGTGRQLAVVIFAAAVLAGSGCGNESGEYTAEGASGALRAPAAARAGSWGPVLTWPVSAVNAHLLPDGRVLFWGDHHEGTMPFTWDPATNHVSELTPPGWNLFCAGHTLLADGTLLVAGGHLGDDNDVGAPSAGTFAPGADTWTRLPDMNAGRWYPSVTVLPNGEAVVVSGMITAGHLNPVPEVLDPLARTWRELAGASREVNDYPRQFAAPNGKLFVAGPAPVALWLDTSGEGTWTTGPSSAFGYRWEENAVLLDGKVLIAGGGDPPTATAEIIDLRDPAAGWTPVAPMSSPRRYANATILPDGTVLVTGGTSGPGYNNAAAAVRAAEVYDPTKNSWTVLASQDGYRGYHSTALLLPDGRVLTAGGEGFTREEKIRTAQIFSPPYLFKGPRPVIASAPADIHAEGTFSVGTSQPMTIRRVALIRLGSVTHAFDMSQRYVMLTFRASQAGLTVSAPPLPDAPPGHYMLFLVNAAGIPSVARIVKLGE